MHRREMFGLVGAMGAGACLGGVAGAADHGSKPDGTMMGPVHGPHAHFCGIHIAKSNPKFQIVTQHYCVAHSGEGHGNDLFQCLLFDTHEKNAKLLGVEYIISDEQFRKLPDSEKKYWHPHTYEVLAGGLIAPSMSDEDEHKFMKMILTTWGKTWHTWPDPKTPIPIGEPLLMWSVTGDGQLSDAVVAGRDQTYKCDTNKIRAKRIDRFGLEVPQVPLPESIHTIGRQWTAAGEDKPTKR
jgi:hypothetical protein